MIANLTQHNATPDQIAAGVFDLPGDIRGEMIRLLTFDALPSRVEIDFRADALADIAAQYTACSAAMIGGAPYLMAPLERALAARGVVVLYAFSRRDAVESNNPDGTVTKSMVFRHAGFVKGE